LGNNINIEIISQIQNFIECDLVIIQSFLKDVDARAEIGDMNNVDKTREEAYQLSHRRCH
jgi:hypothetical protein